MMIVFVRIACVMTNGHVRKLGVSVARGGKNKMSEDFIRARARKVILSGKELIWFEDSPDCGPDCTCSMCEKPILDEDCPAVRLWPEEGGEIRLHTRCWNRLADFANRIDGEEEY